MVKRRVNQRRRTRARRPLLADLNAARRANQRRNAAYLSNRQPLNIPGGFSSPANVVSTRSPRLRGRRRRMGAVPQIGNGGTINIRRCELFYTVTLPANQTNVGGTQIIGPAAKSLLWLNSIIGSYSRIRWDYLDIEWRPAVGTTQNGAITFGVRLMDDRSTIPATTDRATVAALYPVNDHPVWQSSTQLVNRDLLMSRKWYATYATGDSPINAPAYDQSPGTLEFYASAGNQSSSAAIDLGSFWITYSVVLDGTRALNT